MVEEFYVDLIIVVVDMEDVVKLEIDIVNVLFLIFVYLIKKKNFVCINIYVIVIIKICGR